jgi:hypothetical protein
MPITNNIVYEYIANLLNTIGKPNNYNVAPKFPKGKPGKNDKSVREYRLQLINKTNDTSKRFIDALGLELKKNNEINNVSFNAISPNSSKFPSYSFEVNGVKIDAIVAKGANQGENFEKQIVNDLGKYFLSSTNNNLKILLDLMNEKNPMFAEREIAKVEQRTGSTKKEGIPIQKLGEVIGDIVLTDTLGYKWYISLKDTNGDTFSSYSGASSIFNQQGTLDKTSEGSKFLNAFGVDLNKVQSGFDERKGIKRPSFEIPALKPNQDEIKKIFQRAWGMNYFYVRKQTNGWKVFWLDGKKLNELTSNIVVTNIVYPSKSSKQISIFAEVSSYQKYKIEIRNSSGGEYPNDIKFKVIP